jgi:hypothetical protein
MNKTCSLVENKIIDFIFTFHKDIIIYLYVEEGINVTIEQKDS